MPMTPCQRPGVDPEVFFSNHPSDIDRARALCEACPVQLQCAFEAVANREKFGTWGGLTEEQRDDAAARVSRERRRDRVRRARRRAAVAAA